MFHYFKEIMRVCAIQTDNCGLFRLLAQNIVVFVRVKIYGEVFVLIFDKRL